MEQQAPGWIGGRQSRHQEFPPSCASRQANGQHQRLAPCRVPQPIEKGSLRVWTRHQVLRRKVFLELAVVMATEMAMATAMAMAMAMATVTATVTAMVTVTVTVTVTDAQLKPKAEPLVAEPLLYQTVQHQAAQLCTSMISPKLTRLCLPVWAPAT